MDKFVLKSLTVWGVIVMFLTNAWPVIGAFMEWNSITPDMIALFGEQGKALIQAAGMFIGTIMTLWGRFRADTALKILPQ